MLFSMMISLAIASTLVEMMFAARFPIWRKNAHKFKWVNMTISIMLSFILGLMFGAAGLITLGAAMISTVLSIPGYSFLHWNYDSPQAQLNGGNMSNHIKRQTKVSIRKWNTAFKDLGKVIYSIIRIITFPLWATRWLVQQLVKLNRKLNKRHVVSGS